MTRAPSRRVASEPRPGRGVASLAVAQHGATQGVVRAQDPARMAPDARLRELGAILAAGFRRQLENKGPNCLAERNQPEGACETGAVNSPENPEEGIA